MARITKIEEETTQILQQIDIHNKNKHSEYKNTINFLTPKETKYN